MTIRKILTEPDPILKKISSPVVVVGPEEQKLMDDMLQTMYDAKGIGLAAIQIGVPKRIIVMDIIGMIGFMEIAVIIVIIIAAITLAQRIAVLMKNR